MMKRVVKYSIKLFNIKGEFSMVFRFQLNNKGVLQKVQKVLTANAIILCKTFTDLSCQFRTKSQLAHIPTQGIVNINVINTTIPEKRGDIRRKTKPFYFFKYQCIGLVCGMMNNLKK